MFDPEEEAILVGVTRLELQMQRLQEQLDRMEVGSGSR